MGVESGAGRALGKKLDVPVDALLRLLEMVSDCWLVFRDLLEVLIRGMNMETKRAPEESGCAPHSKGSPVVGHPATCSLAPRLMRSQCHPVPRHSAQSLHSHTMLTEVARG